MKRNFALLPNFTVIRDTYTIDSVLGEGAFGVVYKVRHKFLGIQALKVLHPEKLPINSQTDFLNEAFILAKITHPNVVRVFEANHFDINGKKVSYVAMEYVSGGTLDAYLRKHGRLNLSLAIQIQMMICRGLAQAHHHDPSVIHRDVKPQNVMVDTSGKHFVVKVSDFGQAKHVDPLTKLTESAGTLAFMAPEGFWNYKSPASDVYSAGIIFYMMLTGGSPYQMPDTSKYKDEKQVEAMIRKARSLTPKLPSEFSADIDSQLDKIVLKALETDSDKRYQDADEFLQALDDYLSLDHESFKKRVHTILTLGQQYRDLPEAVNMMEAIMNALPDEKKKAFMKRYGIFLESWKKGIIL